MTASSAIIKLLQGPIRVAIDYRFVEKPRASCDCGKPVVFGPNSRRFTCTRCGKRWSLIVRVEPTKKAAKKPKHG